MENIERTNRKGMGQPGDDQTSLRSFTRSEAGLTDAMNVVPPAYFILMLLIPLMFLIVAMITSIRTFLSDHDEPGWG